MRLLNIQSRVKTLISEARGSSLEGALKRISDELPKQVERLVQDAKMREAEHTDIPVWNVVARAESLRDRAILKVQRWIEIPEVKAPMEFSAEPGIAPIYQVRPADNDVWIIVENGSSNPIQTFEKKPQAIKAAKAMARSQKASLDVFTKHGSLQDTYSFA